MGETLMAEPMLVTLPYSSVGEMNRTLIPGLAYWDQDHRLWRDLSESCNRFAEVDYDTQTVSGWICGYIQDRNTRSTEFSLKPTELAVFTMSGVPLNQAPMLVDTSYSVDYNGILDVNPRYYDPEGDEVIFKLTQDPQHGSATLDSKGHLVYTPEHDYFGEDILEILLSEINIPPIYTPQNTSASITLSIPEPNLPPMVIFVTNVSSSGHIFSLANNVTVLTSGNITLHYEGNTTEKDMGYVYLCDQNKDDNIKLLDQKTDTEYVNIDRPEIPYVKPPLDITDRQIERCLANNVKMYRLEAESSKEYHGISQMTLIGFDHHIFSRPIVLQLNTYMNPCVYGECTPLVSLHSCLSDSRTESFDTFACSCLRGYNGDHCQYEINECASNPCNPLYNCQDYVGYHECSPNILRVVGTLAVGAVAAACISILILFGFIQIRKHGKMRQRVSQQQYNEETPRSHEPEIPPVDYDTDDLSDGNSEQEPEPDYSDDESVADFRPRSEWYNDTDNYGTENYFGQGPVVMAYTNRAFVDPFKGSSSMRNDFHQQNN